MKKIRKRRGSKIRVEEGGGMIRLIILGRYMDYDGKSDNDYKTFDVNLPEVEKYLTEKVGYVGCGSRIIVGAEILKNPKH